MNIILANTFTPIYDELEDRVRLVINYQDMPNRVDFMITRSFMLNLVPTAEEFIEACYIDETFVEDKLNNILDNQDSNRTSKTDTTNLELMRTTEELLLEVNFSFDIKTQLTSVTFKSKNKSTRAILDHFTFFQTINIIKASIPYIKWGISNHF